MSLTIRPSHAYAFLSALFIGKFTNLFSDVVITGLILYIVTPKIYTQTRLDKIKTYVWSWIPSRTTAIPIQLLNMKPDIKTLSYMTQLPPLPKIEEVYTSN